MNPLKLRQLRETLSKNLITAKKLLNFFPLEFEKLSRINVWKISEEDRGKKVAEGKVQKLIFEKEEVENMWKVAFELVFVLELRKYSKFYTKSPRVRWRKLRVTVQTESDNAN